MSVNQTRQYQGVAQVDDIGPGWDGHVGANLENGFALHYNHGVDEDMAGSYV